MPASGDRARLSAGWSTALAVLVTLMPAQPVAATVVNLCTGTTGISPCPFPGTALHPTDTLIVLTGNTVLYTAATPSGSFTDSGAVLMRPSSACTLSGWAWLRIATHGVLENAGLLSNEASLQPQDDAVLRNLPGGTLVNTGDFPIYDDGLLENDGMIENYLYMYTLLYPADDPPGDPDNPTVNNRGTLVNFDGGSSNDGWFNNAGTVTNLVGSAFDNTAFLANTGLFVTQGALTNTVYDATGGRITNEGDFRIAAGGSLDRSTATRPYGRYWQSDGRTTVNGIARSSLIYVMSGTLDGGGQIQSVVRVGDGTLPVATLSPGDSLTAVRTLAITGSLALGSDARLAVELSSGGNCDRVTSTGPDTLGGELAVRFTSGSPPSVGDTLTVLTASAVRGTFASVTLNGAPAGGALAVLYGPASVRVVVTAILAVDDAAPSGRMPRLANTGAAYRPEVSLELPASAEVQVSLHDVLGRAVAHLRRGVLAAGSHRLAIDARSIPSGVYFVRAQVRDAAGSHELGMKLVTLH